MEYRNYASNKMMFFYYDDFVIFTFSCFLWFPVYNQADLNSRNCVFDINILLVCEILLQVERMKKSNINIMMSDGDLLTGNITFHVSKQV
jgi:hypothetical protein